MWTGLNTKPLINAAIIAPTIYPVTSIPTAAPGPSGPTSSPATSGPTGVPGPTSSHVTSGPTGVPGPTSSPASPVPTGMVFPATRIIVRLSVDISVISDPVRLARFKLDFVSDVVKALAVRSDRVFVQLVTSGSLVVQFVLLPGTVNEVCGHCFCTFSDFVHICAHLYIF